LLNCVCNKKEEDEHMAKNMKMERYNNLTKDVLKNRVCTLFLPHGLDRSMLWRTKKCDSKN
jgi:hypothetical protein